ncbi:MAG: PD-(D/E)XK nuclease family protein [Candidatus Aminicenantes bacterium]|nr:PD-(D/E)XK nuclease family protein [Candidatus Aminicenantes bacterium]
MAFPRGHLSYSQIRTYLICPRKYEYAYIREISVPLNDKLLLGTVFHIVLEWYFRERISGALPGQNQAEDFYADSFQRFSREQPVRWDDPRDHVYKRGYALVRHFFRELAPQFNPLMVEKELNTPLEGYPVELRGVIDLVEQDLSITDFKTATARWSRNRAYHSRLQMVIYHFLFEKNFGNANSRQRFCVVYSRKGNNVRSQFLEVDVGTGDREHMFQVIEHVADGIREERFPRNEGFRCGFCEFRHDCLGPKPSQRRNHEEKAD